MASRKNTGITSRAFFIMKKEVPQMRAAEKSIGLANRRMVLGDMEKSTPD